jgi:hypothetical protein
MISKRAASWVALFEINFTDDEKLFLFLISLKLISSI